MGRNVGNCDGTTDANSDGNKDMADDGLCVSKSTVGVLVRDVEG